MSTTSEFQPGERDALILRNLVIDKIKSELEKEAIEAIRPAVKRVVSQVVAELEPKIESHFEHLKDRLAINLIFVEPKP